LPQSLDASAELSVERRSRGLFQALIYESKIMLTGRFAARIGRRSESTQPRSISVEQAWWLA
jgi:inner membrane protein involved in colicin E2 resistance